MDVSEGNPAAVGTKDISALEQESNLPAVCAWIKVADQCVAEGVEEAHQVAHLPMIRRAETHTSSLLRPQFSVEKA